jgi:hypothetical protein
LWFWSNPEEAIIFIVLGSRKVTLPNDLIEEKGSKCLQLNVPNKRIYVQQPVFWNSLIMEVCLTEEVLIPGRGSYKIFDKIC